MDFLIDFIDTVSSAEIDSYLNDNSCTVKQVYSNFAKVYLVSCETIPPVTDIVERIVNNSESAISLLEAVDLNPSTVSSSVVLDDEKNWWKVASINDIDFSSETFNHRIYGKNCTVYLMDSGIDHLHPEFDGCDISLFHSFDGTFDDVSGHGTALASLISGKTCGLTNAKIKVVKIFNQGTPTLLSDLVSAFDAIISDIPNSKYAVVNMSWSIARNEYIDHKINLLMEAGVLAVAAAGNAGVPIENVTPAAIANVLTIGSYNQDFEPCDFSNYSGSDVSLTTNQTNFGELDGWAPGVNLYVALPNNRYGYAAGTSYSAAIHSGALAYDVDFFMFKDDNEILPCLAQSIRDTLTYNSLSRHNILSLDQKYAGSKNSISTYAGRTTASLPVEKMRPYFAFIAGIYSCRPVVTRADVKSVEITPELPQGLRFVSPGWLEGTVQLSDTDPDYVIQDYEFKITTIEGQVIVSTIPISVRKDSMDMDNLPQDLLWIRAQGATCFFSGQNCLEPCPAGNPGSLYGICDYIKGTPYCPSCFS